MDNKVKTPVVPEKHGEERNIKTEQKADNKVVMPKFLTVSPSPHMKNPETTGVIMHDVIIALIPAFVWGVYVFGIRALAIAAVSITFSVGFEALTQFLLRRPITIGDLSAVVTGLLISMNMPVTVPLWLPAVGSFFAIVVVKQLFGGIGKNYVNPALAARVFMFSWASEMTGFSKVGERISSFAMTLGEGDIVASATPLASLKAGELPAGDIFHMFIGSRAGCIGEVSSVLLIVGGLYLFIRRVITWHTPVSYVLTVALLTLIFPQSSGDAWTFMLYEVLSGGLLLGAFFMATDYATTPVTPLGRIIFGVVCGLITVLIRYFGSYPEGVSFSILIMNLLVWYIDKATMPRIFGGEKKCRAK